MRQIDLRCWLLCSLLYCLASAPAALATRGGEPSYPKIASHVYAVGQLTESQQETLSWFDLVSCQTHPAVVAEMRNRNPHQRIFYRSMPQSILPRHEDQDFWYADTSWNLMRLCQFYSIQNDWFLYDIYGERILDWDHYVANWTRYCPLGTYGTSVGMTYAEWYINVALPQIAYHSTDQWGESWGWGSSAYDGVAWETLFECPACCAVDIYKYADPDRDGEAEGIDGTCYDGGRDSLTILYRETNDYFYERIQVMLQPDLVINVNRGGTNTNPTWAWNMNGLKLEDWRPSRTDEAQSWWSWMYGRRTQWGHFIGDGYEVAERYMHRSEVDEQDGWDATWLMIWTRGQDWGEAYSERMRRWGLGTTMLGDGYFIFTVNQHDPHWFPEYEWDFGDPVGDFERERVAADTLYYRLFERGLVEVNPYPHTVKEVPAEDARFGFWLTLADLEVNSVAADHITLTWIVPSSETNQIEGTEIRYAAEPITPENWDLSSSAPEGLAHGEPGERMEYTVPDLALETLYYFAAKNLVFGRTEPLISNLVSATTLGQLPDTTEPGELRLEYDFPNPFSEATIRFSIPKRSRTSLRIFDVRGRLVDILADAILDADWHERRWDFRTRPDNGARSGVYFIELRNGKSVLTRRIVALQ